VTVIQDHLPATENPRPWTPHLLALLAAGTPIEHMIDHVFARGGPLEQAGLGYRPQQHDLARVIARRIDKGDGWGMAEAPCGTGKGQAYLLPGVLATLKARMTWKPDANAKRNIAPRMVVSTANIALQDQLVRVDVPLVASLLGIRVRVGLLKGRAQYACRSRLNEALMVRFAGDRGRADLERIQEFLDLNPGTTGDRDALPFGVHPAAWARASIDGESCPGSGCGHYQPADGFAACFAETAKNRAAGAEVLVVNHHYLALAGPLLGPGTLLAVDEAHALEDALRGAQTKEVKKGTAYHLARLCKPVYGNDAAKIVGAPVNRLLDAASMWLRATGAGQGRRPLPAGWARAAGLEPSAFDGLAQAGTALDMLAKGQGGTEEEQRAAKRAEAAAEIVKAVRRRCVTLVTGIPDTDDAETNGNRWAMWAEADGEGSASLGYCPADVSRQVLSLQRTFKAGALVSATLDFDVAALSLGMLNDPPTGGVKPERTAKPAEVLKVASPFPLADLGLLVVPAGPASKDGAWPEWAAAQTVAAVRGSGGGALVLCSSRRQMDVMVAALRSANLPWKILAQGESGRSDLRDTFKADRDSVLVGTKSFFEGLDVQGDACRLVVIDKLPFDPPGDPVEDAVGALASERSGGLSPFMVRSLPRACALLAQAAGRLVRSPTDRGALMLLDNRVLQNSAMGAAARRALPPFPLSRDVRDIARHLAGEKLALAPLAVPMLVNGRATGAVEPEAIPLRRRSAS
jgi:ATP-dependent DNA helicase DinG